MAYRRTPAVQARLNASREAIVRAAIALLTEHGYAGCSVAAVAARAGVATGSVYRHFPSKADLVAEVFRVAAGRELTAVATAVHRQGVVVDRIIAVIETFAGRAFKAPRLAYALLAEPVDPAVDAERLIFRRAYRDLVASSVADGVARGTLPPQNPDVTAAALVGAIAEALVGPLAAGTPDPDTIPSLINFARRAVGGAFAAPTSDGGPPGGVRVRPRRQAGGLPERPETQPHTQPNHRPANTDRALGPPERSVSSPLPTEPGPRSRTHGCECPSPK